MEPVWDDEESDEELADEDHMSLFYSFFRTYVVIKMPYVELWIRTSLFSGCSLYGGGAWL